LLRRPVALPHLPVFYRRTIEAWQHDLYQVLTAFFNELTANVNGEVQGVGAVLASAAELKPTHAIHHVSGTTAISKITVPLGFTGPLWLIPDGAWTLTTGGNIALASTATPSRLMTVCFDGLLWYPSY